MEELRVIAVDGKVIYRPTERLHSVPKYVNNGTIVDINEYNEEDYKVGDTIYIKSESGHEIKDGLFAVDVDDILAYERNE